MFIIFLFVILFLYLLKIKVTIKDNFIDKLDFKKTKIKHTNLYFIHIPKNAGTFFSNNFLESNKSLGHHKIIDIPENKRQLTVAIVRNPYDRMVSLYTYAKKKKSMYHDVNNKHKHFDFASKNSFDEFVKAIYYKKLKHDEHSQPQSLYIIDNKGKCPCKYLLRFENINQEIETKLGLKVNNNIKVNKSSDKDWRFYYKLNNTKKMVYSIYKDDFKNFNYSKDF